jgi:hypothetical protein|tara:strand:+ start:1420 stop:1698 length:279 start_codon:yes stop_codon:yes gene_type:complete
MKGNYRLTVHLTNVTPMRQATGKKIKDSKGGMVEETKNICYNTMSWYFNTKLGAEQKLAEVKADPSLTIKKGTDREKMHKYDKELWYISFVN